MQLDSYIATRVAEPAMATGAVHSRTALLGLLLVFTFCKGLLWAFTIAPLDAPDEPSHLNYIVQIREGTPLPVVDLVSPGGLRTPPSTPLNGELRDYFARYDYKFFRSMPYESAQPPLYYWLAAVWTAPITIGWSNFPTLLLAARLLSVLLGTGAVLALWLAVSFVSRSSLLQWGTPLALALSPEFSFTTATVSNDAGAIFWGAALLAAWAYGLREAERPQTRMRNQVALVLLVGAISAAGILTKLTFVATLPASALWVYWLVARPAVRTNGRRRVVMPWVTGCVMLFGLAAVLVLPWLMRNMSTYGEPTGARAIFDLIHRIYWDRNQFPGEQVFSHFPEDEFVVRSFRSFWALFGWATVWLADLAYWVLALFVMAAGAGLLAARVRTRRDRLASAFSKLAALAAVTLLLAFLNYLGYNSLVEFQPHMRYTFVALASAMLLIVAGLAKAPWRARTKYVVVGVFLATLVTVHVLSLAALWEHTKVVLGSVG